MVEEVVEFGLLGPLEVVADGRRLSLDGSRAGALLALFLLHRNEVVTVDRIVDELWSERPPKTAEQAVRVYVSNLRKALEPGRSNGPPQVLITQGNGYLLRVAPGEVDVERFDARRAEGRRLLAAGDAPGAAEAFDEAMGLWRGPPLQEFAYEGFAHAEIARLEELRLTTLEDRFDALLAAGHGSELVADIAQLVEENPLRERLRAQLMLALYRSGRQADALETYQRGRRLLVEELGLEPSETIRQLEVQILQQDPALDPANASPWSMDGLRHPPPRARRRQAGAVALVLVAVAVGAAGLAVATADRAQRPLRVSFVLSGPRSSLSDPSAGWLDQVDGLQSAAKNAAVRATVLFGGVPPSGLLRTIAAAARTSDLVIVGETPAVEQVSKLTRRFPDTRFLVFDSVLDPAASFAGQRNVTGVNFHDRDNAYLGGYLAGLMTHGHQAVSAVGGVPVLQVRNLIAGFTAGARHARPAIRVLVNYTWTFLDQALCASDANQQINRGSLVVFDVAGSCGFGALQAAGIRGVWGLGVDSNLSYLGPQILASVVKRFDRAIELAVMLFATGHLPRGQDLQLGPTSGSIGLVGISARVPPGVRAKVEAVEAKFLAGD